MGRLSRQHWVQLVVVIAAVSSFCPPNARSQETGGLPDSFRWASTSPLVSPVQRDADPCQAIKDPTVVFHDGKWHLFCTIRSQKRTHQIEYLSFSDWKEADRAERHVLTICDGYFCAPQVFWFEPHRKWYLIFQTSDPTRKPQLQPAFSTTNDIADPKSWSAPTLLCKEPLKTVNRWIDFWVICDDRRAHLFFTSNDGHMWRSETQIADFPHGWKEPQLVLKDDIFEASHTYRLKGQDKYLTVVEAQGGNGWRYYKAYLADRLDGEWKPLAASRDKPFAAISNVEQKQRWTDSISHGELLRSGRDQQLEVDPARLKFLYQGVSDEDRAGKAYGQIPWRLGLLELKNR